MCIQVKDHSRVILEQLQQLRLQTGLVDLDIVCEDHHINVHKVVMAGEITLKIFHLHHPKILHLHHQNYFTSS